jgi:DNA-binding response OmpR family regulator
MTNETGVANLRLGNLEFDPKARVVVVGERQTLLDRRSCSVLLALTEHFGGRVGKDQLLRVAWPNQLVQENSLAKAISRLRRAIDGSGLEIAVTYGAGYSLRQAAVGGPNRIVEPLPSESLELPSTGAFKPPSDENLEPPLLETFAGPQVEGRVPPARSRPFRYMPLAIAFVCLLLTAAASSFFLMGAEETEATRDTPPITNDPPGARATILWVDDNPSNNKLEVAAFRKQRIAVHLAESTEDALKLLAMNSYGLVVSDLGRGEDRLAGLRMIESMKRRALVVPVLIYTVRPKDPRGQQAQRRLVAEAGASDLALTPQEVRAKVLRRLLPPKSV